MRAIVATVALVMSMGPCLAQEKTTIQAMENQLAKALMAGDGKAAAAAYAEDATLLPPGEPLVKGRADIEAYWTKNSAMFAEVRLTTVEVQPLGPDSAREIGTFAGKTKGDPAQSFSGKYVIVLKKAGDEWLISTDIWNADK